MLRRWVALAGLLALPASPLACGDRFGDPIVAAPSGVGAGAAGAAGAAGEAGTDDAGAGGSTGGAGTGGSPAAGEGGAPPAAVGPTGLCGPCVTSNDCGDANDACIRYAGESFCGRDCDEGLGCPDGYQCVQLENSRLLQCVPESRCPAASATPPSLAEIRSYVLARINAERVARDRAPLVASACLDELAQQSALDYAKTDEPLGKFVKECDPVWPACECGWRAEAEASVAHYGLDWSGAVERALSASDERFITSSLDLSVTEAGVGFWISGDEAWIALSLR